MAILLIKNLSSSDNLSKGDYIMRYLKILIITAIGLLYFSESYAQVALNKVGQSTMDFLLVSISPKASAMGDAYTSLCAGAESMFYNPAGLIDIPKSFDITVDYTQWIADINYLGGGIGYSLGNYGAVGLSFLTVDYGTIYATRLSPTIGAAGYVEDGEMQNVGAYSFGLSYAKAISEKFSIGGTMKYVGQNLGQNDFSNGVSKKNDMAKLAFDAGIKFNTGFKDFIFGMAIRNFASNVKRELDDEQLPLTFTMGGAISIMEFINPEIIKDQNITLAVDYLHSNSYSERVNLGVEYKYMNMISLRAGYQTNRDIMSWSAGVGFNTSIAGNLVEANYSFSKIDSFFSNVSRLSIGFSF